MKPKFPSPKKKRTVTQRDLENDTLAVSLNLHDRLALQRIHFPVKSDANV